MEQRRIHKGHHAYDAAVHLLGSREAGASGPAEGVASVRLGVGTDRLLRWQVGQEHTVLEGEHGVVIVQV